VRETDGESSIPTELSNPLTWFCAPEIASKLSGAERPEMYE